MTLSISNRNCACLLQVHHKTARKLQRQGKARIVGRKVVVK